MIRGRLLDGKPAILVFGGTFDPIHTMHLDIPCAVFHELPQMQHNRVVFVPTCNPPHKPAALAPGWDRLTMVRVATQEDSRFRTKNVTINSFEISLQRIVYTVETMQHMADCYPEFNIAFIVGGDMAADLPNWKDPDKLIEIAEPIMVARPESNVLDWQFSSVEMGVDSISSSRLRDILKEGDYDHPDLSTYMHSRVLDYIRYRKLYLTD